MPRKILTLDDLYNYYSSTGRSTHFNAKNDGDRIVVQVKGMAKFEKSDKDTEGLLPVSLQACHIGENLNKSFISEETMLSALPSFANRPILGYIYEDENGDPQFRDHTIHIDENGEIVYDEKPIGIIPSENNARLEYDEEKDRTYVCVDGYIFEEYSKASEILSREQECAVSVELSIRSLSYDAKKKLMNIEDFYFAGVTALGKWEDGSDVEPGMAGSNIKIADFKQKNNTTFSQHEMIATLNEINEKLDRLTITQFSKEGGENSDMTKFEELLEQYGVTAEEIDFEYEGMSDEELEAAFAEKFAEDTSSEENTAEEAEGDAEDNAEEPEEDEEEVEEEAEEENTEDEEETPADNFTKLFELSHEDIRYALYQLLTQFEVDDNEWYGINAVYDDHFVYQGMFGGKIYGQKFAIDGDVVSFVEDRYELHAEYLTDGELAVLNEMRANYAKYAEDHEKLLKYEAEPEKMALIESEDYSNLAESEAFEALKAQENHFDLSMEEIKAQLDEMLLEYAKGHKVEFTAKESRQVSVKRIKPVRHNKGNGKYGGVFDRNK